MAARVRQSLDFARPPVPSLLGGPCLWRYSGHGISNPVHGEAMADPTSRRWPIHQSILLAGRSSSTSSRLSRLWRFSIFNTLYCLNFLEQTVRLIFLEQVVWPGISWHPFFEVYCPAELLSLGFAAISWRTLIISYVAGTSVIVSRRFQASTGLHFLSGLFFPSLCVILRYGMPPPSMITQ